VAEVVYAVRAQADLDRLFDFLAEHDLTAAATAIGVIVDAVSVLGRHPLIGRPVELGFRELVISYGKSGYVALYRYFEDIDTALVLAIRHQREAGFSENG